MSIKIMHRAIIISLSLMVACLLIWTFHEAFSYYLTSKLDRPRHPGHSLWKPGGNLGHSLGILGGGMMILMFIYSVRKRVRFFHKWGRLSTWLNYHIFLGISGPVLVTFHTAFKFEGLVSISYWSMVAVALSGFIGRYIYIKIPHRVSGAELSREEFKQRIKNQMEILKADYNLSQDSLQLINSLSGGEKIKEHGLWGVFTILLMDISSFFKRRQIKKEIIEMDSVPMEMVRQFSANLKIMVKMNRQIAFWNAAQNLFHYWHVVHKPFAYTMIVIMIIHIIVAVSLGFAWVF